MKSWTQKKTFVVRCLLNKEMLQAVYLVGTELARR